MLLSLHMYKGDEESWHNESYTQLQRNLHFSNFFANFIMLYIMLLAQKIVIRAVITRNLKIVKG